MRVVFKDYSSDKTLFEIDSLDFIPREGDFVSFEEGMVRRVEQLIFNVPRGTLQRAALVYLGSDIEEE